MTVIDTDGIVHDVSYEPVRIAVQIDGYIEEQPGYTSCAKPFGWAKAPGEPFVVLGGSARHAGGRVETVCHAMRGLSKAAKVTCIECLAK